MILFVLLLLDIVYLIYNTCTESSFCIKHRPYEPANSNDRSMDDLPKNDDKQVTKASKQNVSSSEEDDEPDLDIQETTTKAPKKPVVQPTISEVSVAEAECDRGEPEELDMQPLPRKSTIPISIMHDTEVDIQL